ncbi:MAG: hypothetical protein ABI398_01445 [Devosia sp.]
MSAIDVTGVAIVEPATRPFFRPATLLVAVVSVGLLLLAARHVIDEGYLRKDIAALEARDAWRSGGWLSQVVLRIVSFLPGRDLRESVLSLIAAVAAGAMFGALYDRLRRNGWIVISAILLLLAIGLHAGELYTVTASSRAIPVYLAFAALIPAIRSLEDVGDVQSAIALGLLLPLLLLASPITTPLILLLAIGAALADPDGRRDPRAFAAMLLVALLPTLIVMAGIFGFLVQAGLDPADALAPYVATYSSFRIGDVAGSFAALVVYAPVLLVPIAYCVWPGLPDRRRIVSALAVITLPLYLVAARSVINTAMTAIVPPLALIAAFVSWVAVVRLPIGLRVFALAMLVLSAVLSWSVTGLWDDPAWKAALLNFIPSFDLRPGI